MPDTYIQNFAYSKHNQRVAYTNLNNTLTLYAAPSSITSLLYFIIGSTLGIVGIAALADSTRGHENSLASAIIGIPFSFLGAWVGAAALSDIAIKQSERGTSFITLDQEGLSFFNKYNLYWKNVHHIEIRSVVKTNAYGHEISRTRTANFVNEAATVLFSMVETNGNLPISFDEFIAVARHYVKKYSFNQSDPVLHSDPVLYTVVTIPQYPTTRSRIIPCGTDPFCPGSRIVMEPCVVQVPTPCCAQPQPICCATPAPVCTTSTNYGRTERR